MSAESKTILEVWEKMRRFPQAKGRTFQFTFNGSLFTSQFIGGRHCTPVITFTEYDSKLHYPMFGYID